MEATGVDVLQRYLPDDLIPLECVVDEDPAPTVPPAQATAGCVDLGDKVVVARAAGVSSHVLHVDVLAALTADAAVATAEMSMGSTVLQVELVAGGAGLRCGVRTLTEVQLVRVEIDVEERHVELRVVWNAAMPEGHVPAHLAVSPSGWQAAVTVNGRLGVWDGASGKGSPLCRMSVGDVLQAVFAGGRRALWGVTNKWVLSTATVTLLHRHEEALLVPCKHYVPRLLPGEALVCVEASHPGRLLAVGTTRRVLLMDTQCPVPPLASWATPAPCLGAWLWAGDQGAVVAWGGNALPDTITLCPFRVSHADHPSGVPRTTADAGLPQPVAAVGATESSQARVTGCASHGSQVLVMTSFGGGAVVAFEPLPPRPGSLTWVLAAVEAAPHGPGPPPVTVSGALPAGGVPGDVAAAAVAGVATSVGLPPPDGVPYAGGLVFEAVAAAGPPPACGCTPEPHEEAAPDVRRRVWDRTTKFMVSNLRWVQRSGLEEPLSKVAVLSQPLRAHLGRTSEPQDLAGVMAAADAALAGLCARGGTPSVAAHIARSAPAILARLTAPTTLHAATLHVRSMLLSPKATYAMVASAAASPAAKLTALRLPSVAPPRAACPCTPYTLVPCGHPCCPVPHTLVYTKAGDPHFGVPSSEAAAGGSKAKAGAGVGSTSPEYTFGSSLFDDLNFLTQSQTQCETQTLAPWTQPWTQDLPPPVTASSADTVLAVPVSDDLEASLGEEWGSAP